MWERNYLNLCETINIEMESIISENAKENQSDATTVKKVDELVSQEASSNL